MVRFEDVALRYAAGPEILRRVSFRLDPGSFHFVLGPSGAGKSSLLRLMYLAQRPSGGRIFLSGRDTAEIDRREATLIRRRIGFVFQNFRLLGHLTVRENVALPLRIAGETTEKSDRHVGELLDWVGLGKHLDDLPETLSGGQQQRVAIARAVIAKPSLLLADEPTGNVDHSIALRLLHLFQELNRFGTTVVIATHNESLVDRLNHPVLRLQDGKIGKLAAARIPARPSRLRSLSG